MISRRGMISCAKLLVFPYPGGPAIEKTVNLEIKKLLNSVNPKIGRVRL